MLILQKSGRTRQLKERPERFLLNRHHPLYGSLVFAGLGQMAGGYKYRDSSTYHNDGSLINYGTLAPQSWSRALGRAFVQVNGSPSYIGTAQPPQLSGNITLLGWFRGTVSSSYRTALFDCVYSSSHSITNGVTYDIGYIGGSPNTYQGLCSTKTGWQHGNASIGISFATHHYAVSIESQAIRFYLDGVFDGVVSHTPNAIVQPTQVALVGRSYDPMYANGSFADIIACNGLVLSPSIIARLADPSNVMLDTGHGQPLILPPKRKIFPNGLQTKYYKVINLGITNYETTSSSQLSVNSIEPINYGIQTTTSAITNKEILTYEVNKKLFGLGTPDYNASQKINRTEILDYDASQKINRTEILDYDASQKINRTEILDYDASQKINRTEILDYEDAQKLSKQQIINYTSSQSLYNKEMLDYEVKKPTTSKEIINYDDKQTITVTRPEVLNYMVGAQIINTERLIYEASSATIITPVNRNEFINYEVGSKLIRGEILDYNINSIVVGKDIINYAVNTSITAITKAILNYMVKQGVLSAERLIYDASQKINRTEILDYDASQKINRTEILDYDASQKINRTEILDYEDAQKLSKQQIINYTSSQSLYNKEMLDYEVKKPTTSKEIINYDDKQTITVTRPEVLNYMVGAQIINTERLIYEASSLTVVYPVSCNELLNYEVKKTLIKPGTSNYNTLSKQIIIGSADYETLSRILNKSTFDYTVLQGVQSKNLPVVYNTVQGIGLFGGLDYNTIMRISSKSVLNYEVNKIIQAHTYAILSYQILHALINYGIECYEVDGTIFVINPYTKNIYSLDTLLRTWILDGLGIDIVLDQFIRNIELDTLNRTWVLDQLNRTFVL